MNKSFTGILSDYVLIHVKGEAGQSGATLRSYYTAIDQYTEWYTRTHKTKPEAMDASSFAKDDVRASATCAVRGLCHSLNSQGRSVLYIHRLIWTCVP